MKRLFILLIFWVCVIPCSSQTIPELYRKADAKKMNHWADSVFDSMSYDERIGQLFMVIANPTADSKNIQLLNRYIDEIKMGGILFHKGNAVAQATVTNRIQKASKTPLLVSLDGEWGLSMRLDGTTRFPKNMMLGAIEDSQLIEEYGKEVGRQCQEMGIHINFAPDIDINNNVDNPVIGLRSFGEDPDAVAEKGIAYARGLESMGVLSVAKHFPGHGDTSEDSHNTLPTIRHSMQRLDSVELLPFKRYIYEGFAGVMTGHLFIPALDKTPNTPVSLSRKAVTDLLQKKQGFQGLCFTDALAMKGASPSKSDNPSVKALLAGNDILLASPTPFSDFTAIKEAIKDGTLDLKEIESRCLKILRYKYIAGLNQYKPIQLKGLDERLNSPHAAWLAAKLNSEAITILKNEKDIIPVKGLDKKKIAVLSIGEETGNNFQSMLNEYDKVDCFSIMRGSTAAQIQRVYKQLEGYDLIICGVHTVRIPEDASLVQLAAKKDLVYVFFTLPYFCKEYKSLTKAKGVVMAYETTPLAQEYAAQAVFGGIAGKGKLPVTIPNLYYAGTGIFTEKTRLGYHEPEEVGVNVPRLDVINSIVQEGLQEKAYPGCQVLIAKNGYIIYNKSFGRFDFDKNSRRVNESSVYDLASASKAAGTLLAVMKTYDDKKCTLNSKISEYIPELKGSDKSDLTIKELLYHQSGVVPTINFYTNAIDKDSYKGSLYSGTKDDVHTVRFDAKTFVINDFSFNPALVSDTLKPGFTTEVARNFFLHDSFKDTIIQEIKKSRLGTRGKYAYSCINFIMLKMMVEKQTGKPMDQLLHSSFFDRLGAIHTTYNPLHTIDTLEIVPTEDDQFLRRQILRGYVHDEAAAFQGGVSGNAGLFSNANDLAKVLQLLLNQGTYGGEQYLSQETSRLFTQSKSPTSRRGLGFDKPAPDSKGSPCGALTPPSVYGHTGFTGTCFWIDPDNRLIYIFLCNRVYPSRANNKLSSLDIRPRIQDAIYKSLDR